MMFISSDWIRLFIVGSCVSLSFTGNICSLGPLTSASHLQHRYTASSLVVSRSAVSMNNLLHAKFGQVPQASHITISLVSFASHITGGNRAKLPSSRWHRRGRSLREVFACSCLFATTDLSQICNRVTRGHGTPCSKTTDSYLSRFVQ